MGNTTNEDKTKKINEIKKLIAEKKYTQNQIAEIVKCSPRLVNDVANNRGSALTMKPARKTPAKAKIPQSGTSIPSTPMPEVPLDQIEEFLKKYSGSKKTRWVDGCTEADYLTYLKLKTWVETFRAWKTTQ